MAGLGQQRVQLGQLDVLPIPGEAGVGITTLQPQDAQVRPLGLRDRRTGRRGKGVQGADVAGDVAHQRVTQPGEGRLDHQARLPIGERVGTGILRVRERGGQYLDQRRAGVDDEVGEPTHGGGFVVVVVVAAGGGAYDVGRAGGVGPGLGTSQDGADLEGGAEDLADVRPLRRRQRLRGVDHLVQPDVAAAPLRAKRGDEVHHLDDLAPVAGQDVDLVVAQQLDHPRGRHQVAGGQDRGACVLQDLQNQIQRSTPTKGQDQPVVLGHPVQVSKYSIGDINLPVQVAPHVCRQDPVSGADQPQGPQKTAELGPLAAVLGRVRRKEQWLRIASPAGDTRVGVVAVRVFGAEVVDESLCQHIPARC